MGYNKVDDDVIRTYTDIFFWKFVWMKDKQLLDWTANDIVKESVPRDEKITKNITINMMICSLQMVIGLWHHHTEIIDNKKLQN